MFAAYAKSLFRLPRLHKLFYLLTVIVIIFVIAEYATPVREGMKAGGANKFTLKQGPAIYDDFYVSIYDDLLFSKTKNDFEINEIIQHTQLAKQSRILDIGSGCGHHVSALTANGFTQVQGLDISPFMVRQARTNYPTLKFIEGDAMNTMLFPSDAFTHITCFYFTIYYMQDKARFFQNCAQWLHANGMLIVHLVDPAHFDPIVPAGDPFRYISPQSYVSKRITQTTVKFDEFDYKSDFKLLGSDALPEHKPEHEQEPISRGVGEGIQDVNATLTETFTYKNNNAVRKNEHAFYMPDVAAVLNLAKQAGFIVRGKIDLVTCQYAYQYLYILEKPT